MTRIALGIEYDGQPYKGWQIQADQITVQQTLQQALSQIACHPVQVTAAGRTDTGVHAEEQVVHFDTQAVRPLSAWVRGVNSWLPDSIAVRWAQPVSENFHARFSAVARSYRYLLINRPVRSALYAGKAGWFHLPLDLSAMQQAAACLLGQHDFSAFRAAQCQARSPVKTLSRLDIQRQDNLFVFELQANAFLHHMVRNIIGCLVYIGKGKYPPQWLTDIRDSRSRKQAAPTFAPDGLYLTKISYPPQYELPDIGSVDISQRTSA